MNYRINKRRKNYSKKQNSSKEILLHSLNQKFSTNNQQKQIIIKPINNFQNFNKLNNSLKKTDKKFDKPRIFSLMLSSLMVSLSLYLKFTLVAL